MRSGLRLVLNAPLFAGQLCKAAPEVSAQSLLLTAPDVGETQLSSFLVKVNAAVVADLVAAIIAEDDAQADTVAQSASPSLAEAADAEPVAQLATTADTDDAVETDESHLAPNMRKPMFGELPKPFGTSAFVFGGTKAPEQTSPPSPAAQELDKDKEVHEEAQAMAEDTETEQECNENYDEQVELASEAPAAQDNEMAPPPEAIGAKLAQATATSTTAGRSAAASADAGGVSKEQLAQYQDALEAWVVLAQKEEKQRVALEQQLLALTESGAGNGATANDTAAAAAAQVAAQAAQEEVSSLQAQLRSVQKACDDKLADLNAKMGAAAAAQASAEESNRALRRHAEEVEAEVAQLRTPQKPQPPAEEDEAAAAAAVALKESERVVALESEVKLLKELFLASMPASPAGPAPGDAAPPRPSTAAIVPSPRRVLASPQPIRGTPRAQSVAQQGTAADGQHMRCLNRQIRDWVNAAAPNSDLTPQLQDYIAHVQGWRQVHTKWFQAAKPSDSDL
jgi:hypothetical protein